MDFAWAINALKAGLKVTRQGWNGKGMFLWLMPATDVKAEWCKEPVLKGLAEANGGTIPCLGTIRMYTHDSAGRHAVLTGWLASQSDMLSDDWKVYFGEGHEKQTPEEIEAYKKLMLDRMPGGSFGQQMRELGTLKAQQEKADIDKLPKEDIPVWPEVNADGYSRMSKDSDVLVHDGVYRRKREPAKAEKDWTEYAGGIVCPAEDTGYIAELFEMLADSYAEKISQRVAQLLQKS